MINNIDSRAISTLRLPLIIGVICIHARLGGGNFGITVRRRIW